MVYKSYDTMSNQKFTKEDQKKLQEELEREREEELEDKEEEEQQEKEQKEKEETKHKNKKTKKHKKTKRKKDKKRRKRDRNSKDDKKHFPFLLAFIILLLVGLVVGIAVYCYMQDEKDVEFDYSWQEVYYNYLEKGLIKQCKDDNGKSLSSCSNVYQEKSPRMYMISVNNNDAPAMIIESNGLKDDYDDGNSYKNLMTIHSINSGIISLSKHYDVLKIIFLYNIEDDSFGWYLYEKDKEGSYVYTSLDDIVNYSDSNARKYKFENSSDFDKAFIEVKVNFSKYGLNTNMSENKLKNTIIKATNKIKLQNEIVNEDVVEDVKNKVSKLEEEKEEVQTEEKQDEDTTTENIDGFKVGDYIISYGIYFNSKEVLTLNKNGKCHYKNTDDEIDSDGTYAISDSNSIIVSIKDDKIYFDVTANNRIMNKDKLLTYKE